MAKFIKNTFINREYSWLKFNERVLEEAECETNPLLEKCKFLSIFTSNLDEFFMVRVGSLFNDMLLNPKATENKTGLTPLEQLNGIYSYTKKLYTKRKKVAKDIFKSLKEEGIAFKNIRLNNKKIAKPFEKYFFNSMLPLLNPIVLDNKHPFIHLENQKMYVIVHLQKSGKDCFGILPVPSRCERLVAEQGAKELKLMAIEDITYYFADHVFSKYNILGKSLVRLTRNADFDSEIYSVDYENEYDFPRLLKGKVETRTNLPPVRLELSNKNEKILKFLCKHLEINQNQCFKVEYYFDYKFFFSLDKLLTPEHSARLKYTPFKGRIVPLKEPESVMNSVFKKDIFLSYPFDSMDTFLDLLDEASVDPRTASIKITIYRLDKHSRVIEALRRASRNGKDVTAIIELTARFDEENNLHYASVLKEAGCTVLYGVGNYKVHSKIALIVLKEGEKISYITHLGTGNYNEGTSKQYTDLNVITADNSIGLEAAGFFRDLSMGNTSFNCKELLVAPKTLKEGLLWRIREQTRLAEEGKPNGIICKMNSLTDMDFIKEFIRASCAGVKIQLIVRGICCLLPGIKGKTENITVKSIIGRFLEHSRIYCFGTIDPDIYISSADLMTRNVAKRVEIASPVKDKDIKKRLMKMIEVMLNDNEKSSYLTSEGSYIRKSDPGVSSQEYFMNNDINK